MLLDARGIECSTGSACSAGVPQPSHVLLAMGCTDEPARHSLRFSLGHTSTQADVDAVVEAIGPVVERARAAKAPEMRVIAAMSGGVDSAVAAARAAEAGHDVTGIHLALSRNPASYRSGARGCCTIEDSNDARRAADVIGIPFYVWDLSERFHEDVVEDFMDEYAAGRTPNPCLRCNEKIKFAAVLDRALGLGLRRGRDRPLRAAAHRRRRADRDAPRGRPRQGPVLRARRARPAAARALAVPARRLDQGRRAARRRPRAGCWSPTSRTATTSASSPTATTPAGCARSSATGRPTTAATIVDEATGEVLGRHDGTYGFTIGQRKGLRLGHPAPDGKPRFVLDIEPVSGTVTVGPRERLAVDRLTASGRAGAAPCRRAPDRTHRPAARARRRAPGGRPGRREAVEIELLDPAYGIAPGQAAVVYDGTRVVGSATIAATRRAG